MHPKIKIGSKWNIDGVEHEIVFIKNGEILCVVDNDYESVWLNESDFKFPSTEPIKNVKEVFIGLTGSDMPRCKLTGLRYDCIAKEAFPGSIKFKITTEEIL